ncbi:MAG: hypothetical protein U0Q11_07005 [Vicinamibacterales bacterium]
MAATCRCSISTRRFSNSSERYDFSRSPLDDIKASLGCVTSALSRAAAATRYNVHVLRDFREHCRVLIAVGQCAITGGLPAMRNGIPMRELFETSYGHGPTLDNSLIPNDEELPAILTVSIRATRS